MPNIELNYYAENYKRDFREFIYMKIDNAIVNFP
ncbi:MAG: hypothetical protein ACI9IP_002493 [Arcticibacterium sp.]|jgi:hypothetical protein